MEVEVLIPHLNRRQSLGRTLDSMRLQTRSPRVCVIDNGSTDGTLSMLSRRFPEVRCLALDRNHGFGAAINRGVESSTADLVVLVNNDAVADARFIEELLAAHSRTGAEMIAGCMRMRSGFVESLGVEIDRSLVAYDVGFGQSYPSFPAEADPVPLGPSGGAAAFDRMALISIGGFDEAFFAYLEDLDLALRMRAAGMKCVSAWRAFVWHEHSATLGSGSSAKNRLMGRSRGLILWKHGGNLSRGNRVRGMTLDALVYAGQAVHDRNLGAIRGRRGARASVRGLKRPPGTSVAEDLVVPRSLLKALALRRSRRP